MTDQEQRYLDFHTMPFEPPKKRTNFEQWISELRPAPVAEFFGSLSGDACLKCPARNSCNIDDRIKMDDPTIMDACRAMFFEWANEEAK